MKKNRAWAVLIIVGMCCAGFICYQIAVQRRQDHTPPTIYIPEGVFEISVKTERDALLADVTARDDKDGDVTNLLLVESVSDIRSDHTAQVNYAAFDSAGNVSKKERTVHYTDYESPRFTLSQPLLFRSGSRFDVFDYVGAQDAIDGTLDDAVKGTLISADTSISELGVHEVQFRVTNSMGDTAYLIVPVEVYAAADYDATVDLTQPLVYLKTGDTFHAASYLDTFTYGTKQINLRSNAESVEITTDSDVNTNLPGYYSVSYTVRSGTNTGHTRLIVVVEE